MLAPICVMADDGIELSVVKSKYERVLEMTWSIVDDVELTDSIDLLGNGQVIACAGEYRVVIVSLEMSSAVLGMKSDETSGESPLAEEAVVNDSPVVDWKELQ